jgi:hypothetical protein
MANGNREMQLGLAHLAHRLQAVGLQILKQARPWPNRTAIEECGYASLVWAL